MKILILVFRSTFTEAIVSVLEKLCLSGYTEIPQVYGSGHAGRVFESHAWPGHNSLVLTALSEDDIERILMQLKEFLKESEKSGEQTPLKVFAVPCEQLL
jgi:hypothetical protein